MSEKKNKVLLILVALISIFAITATVVGSVYLMKNTQATNQGPPKTDSASNHLKQKKKKPMIGFKRPVKPKPVSGTRNQFELTKANSTVSSQKSKTFNLTSLITNATTIEPYTNATSFSSSLTTEAKITNGTSTTETAYTTTTIRGAFKNGHEEKSILVVNTLHKDAPFLLDKSGQKTPNFTFEDNNNHKIYGEISIIFKGEFWMFGGGNGLRPNSKISKVIGCEVKEVGQMRQNDRERRFGLGRGAVRNDETIYLCFSFWINRWCTKQMTHLDIGCFSVTDQ